MNLFSDKRDNGAALLELSVIISLIFLVGFVCIDFARVFRTYEAMSAISREAARIPLLECEEGDFGQCMTAKGLYPRIQGFAEGALSGSEVIITAYDLIGVGAATTVKDQTSIGIYPIPGTSPVQYGTLKLHRASNFNPGLFYDSVTKTVTTPLLYDFSPTGPSKRRMIVAEVYYSLRSVAPSSYLYIPREEVLHEVTLY